MSKMKKLVEMETLADVAKVFRESIPIMPDVVNKVYFQEWLGDGNCPTGAWGYDYPITGPQTLMGGCALGNLHAYCFGTTNRTSDDNTDRVLNAYYPILTMRPYPDNTSSRFSTRDTLSSCISYKYVSGISKEAIADWLDKLVAADNTEKHTL